MCRRTEGGCPLCRVFYAPMQKCRGGETSIRRVFHFELPCVRAAVIIGDFRVVSRGRGRKQGIIYRVRDIFGIAIMRMACLEIMTVISLVESNAQGLFDIMRFVGKYFLYLLSLSIIYNFVV